MESNVLRLKDILMQKNVKTLRKLGKGYYISGTAKMHKEELAEAVQEAMMQPGRLGEALYTLNADEKRFILDAAAADGPIPVTKKTEICARIFFELGYLAYDKEAETAEMPVETIAVLAVLEKEGYWARKERADLLFAYCQAAVNLYGAIRQGELVEIFNRQNEEKTDASEMFRVQMRHLELDAAFCIWNDYLVSVSFKEDNFEDLPELLQEISLIPRYIPEKDIFLRYTNELYYEKTIHTARLTAALEETYQISNADAKALVLEVVIALQSQLSLSNIMKQIAGHGFVVTGKMLPEMVKMITAIRDTTRMWTQKGHTINELEQLKNERKMTKGRGVQTRQKLKIGRNDPCPCGSGKKFKKCCGR